MLTHNCQHSTNNLRQIGDVFCITPITYKTTVIDNAYGRYIGDTYVETLTNNNTITKRNGHGTLDFQNGFTYDGMWFMDKCDGFGSIFTKNSNTAKTIIHTGEWKNNISFDDKKKRFVVLSDNFMLYFTDIYPTVGTIIECVTFIHNGTYFGEVVVKNNLDVRIIGFGHYDDEYKAQYDGNWIDGVLIDGFCKYDVGDTYQGKFGNGFTKHGNGIYESRGCVKNGEWYNNIFVSGTVEFSNGDIYHGKIKNNKMDGKAIYKFANGDVFDGTWENDFMVGNYQCIFSDKVIDGTIVNGNIFGYGKIRYFNGDMFEGIIDTNNPTQHGTYVQYDFDEIVTHHPNIKKTQVTLYCSLCNIPQFPKDLELACGKCNNLICKECKNKLYCYKIDLGYVVHKSKFLCCFCKNYPIEQILKVDSKIKQIFETHEICAKCNICTKYEGLPALCDNDYHDTHHTCVSCIKTTKDLSQYKQCPNCTIYLEKISGCNHIKCGYCKYDFCFVCLVGWNQNHLGCRR